jgi:hypothetical protein
MRLFKSFLAVIMLMMCVPLAGQPTSFEELEFEPDSITMPYKPAGKNFVFIRSKRGTSGLNKTPAADAIKSAEVTEIVLVFSELDPSAIADREEANRERWENLLMTYPEYFQFSTTYKNLCQCNNHGDSASFKKAQGFYVYINGEAPKVEEPKTVVSAPVTKTEKTPEKKTEEPVVVAKTAKVEEKKPEVKETAVVEKPAKITEEPVKAKETVKETVKEPEPPASNNASEETPVTSAPEPVKETPKKKTASAGTAKPRKARDPKACRPACYGFGDEDLQAFFKDNIPLTKKQRRKAKKWIANVRLQIHFDGTIKKAMITGTDETFNQQVDGVIKAMNRWNPAVKSGTTVKSEVRFTLKYDKETKSMKPYDLVMNPKASPKCPCVSDSELFD